MIDFQEPALLIGSPMCTALLHTQNLSKAKRDPAAVEQELIRARVHLHLCCHLYRKQMDRGAVFLHEHPALATSWREKTVRELLGRKEVMRIVADQCQLGQQTDAGFCRRSTSAASASTGYARGFKEGGMPSAGERRRNGQRYSKNNCVS